MRFSLATVFISRYLGKHYSVLPGQWSLMLFRLWMKTFHLSYFLWWGMLENTFHKPVPSRYRQICTLKADFWVDGWINQKSSHLTDMKQPKHTFSSSHWTRWTHMAHYWGPENVAKQKREFRRTLLCRIHMYKSWSILTKGKYEISDTGHTFDAFQLCGKLLPESSLWFQMGFIWTNFMSVWARKRFQPNLPLILSEFLSCPVPPVAGYISRSKAQYSHIAHAKRSMMTWARFFIVLNIQCADVVTTSPETHYVYLFPDKFRLYTPVLEETPTHAPLWLIRSRGPLRDNDRSIASVAALLEIWRRYLPDTIGEHVILFALFKIAFQVVYGINQSWKSHFPLIRHFQRKLAHFE